MFPKHILRLLFFFFCNSRGLIQATVDYATRWRYYKIITNSYENCKLDIGLINYKSDRPNSLAAAYNWLVYNTYFRGLCSGLLSFLSLWLAPLIMCLARLTNSITFVCVRPIKDLKLGGIVQGNGWGLISFQRNVYRKLSIVLSYWCVFSYRCDGDTSSIINYLTGILSIQNWLTYGEPLFKTNYLSATPASTPKQSVLRAVVFHLFPTY